MARCKGKHFCTFLIRALAILLLPCVVFAALLTCPDCGKQVSTHARSCPSCGCPVRIIIDQSVSSHGTGNKTVVTNHQPTTCYSIVKNSLVTVQTDTGTGSGFVVSLDGKKYVISNAHVLAGASEITLIMPDGTRLQWTQLSLAQHRDLVRLAIVDAPQVHALPIHCGAINIGDHVTVYGSSMGRAVVTELPGRVIGLGAEELEIDCTFVQGNSGSPILTRDGSVLGVATYVSRARNPRDWVISGTRFEDVRRFGIRLRPAEEWVAVPEATFRQQVNLLGDLSTIAGDLAAIAFYYIAPVKAGRLARVQQLLGVGRVHYPFSPRKDNAILAPYRPEDDLPVFTTYFSDTLPALLRKFVLARHHYMELASWEPWLNDVGNLRGSSVNQYRALYGHTFNRNTFRMRFTQAQADRDKAYAALCAAPIQLVDNTPWATQWLRDWAHSYRALFVEAYTICDQTNGLPKEAYRDPPVPPSG